MKIKRVLVLSTLIFSLVSTGCNNNNKVSEQVAKRPFSDVTEFDEEVDIHTEDQKAFVSFTGGYEKLSATTIKNNYHVTGNDSFSDPNAIHLTWEQEPLETLKNYTVELSKDENFANYVTYVGTKAKSIDLYNVEIGTQYFYRIKANYDDESETDVSKVYTFTTADIAPRNLKVSGMTNCRDLGGRNTVNGGRIKQGLLYRTAALDDSQSQSIIDEEGIKTMRDVLKVKTEIELRGGPNGDGGEAKNTKTSGLGNDIKFEYIPFAYSNGKNLLFRNIEPVRKVFDVLGDESNYPVFFHCRIGTDRTGLIGLLVNALVGVELQDIYQDYLFSDFGRIGKTSTVGQNNEDSIAGYVQQLQAFPGDTLQNKVYNFLLTAGVPAAKLDTLINVLTEGDKPTNSANKIAVTTVDNMTLTGAAMTSKTATRSPAKQANFTAASQKASYTFTSDKAFSAKLFANIMSKNTSLTIANAFTVTIDGTPVTLKTTSFATTSLGFGTQAEYWIPAEFADITVPAGSHTIVIETKTATAISLSQIAFQMDTNAIITKA